VFAQNAGATLSTVVVTPAQAAAKPGALLGIPDDRDRSFRRIVTEDSDLS
jgi:hypothetical protein